jgi:hypothetical protein
MDLPEGRETAGALAVSYPANSRTRNVTGAAVGNDLRAHGGAGDPTKFTLTLGGLRPSLKARGKRLAVARRSPAAAASGHAGHTVRRQRRAGSSESNVVVALRTSRRVRNLLRSATPRAVGPSGR